MYIDFEAISANKRYFTMTQSVLPRPIAWILTDNGDGGYNLAPFSYFNAICSDPPLLMVSVGHKPDGERKDTVVNLAERKHCVVHIPHREQAAVVTETSRTLAHGDSELDRTELSLAPFDGFVLPRLAACRLAYACDLHEIKAIGGAPQQLLLLEVKGLYIDDAVVDIDDRGRTKIDAVAVDPLARLGATEYGALGAIIDVPRPQ